MAEELKKTKAPLSVGLLAHVDAGKTTLSEAMLYGSGARRVLGRVDHGDAYLDTDRLERERGITIFSKQARLETKSRAVTLVDTPLRQRLSGCCVDLAQPWESLSEAAALCDEALLEALDTYGPEPKYPQDFIFLPDEALGIYSGPLRKMAAQLY